MDAAALDFADATFDAVISVEAAFHFSTRSRFFAEAARVLRPGGRLVLSDILYRDVSVVGGWMVPASNRITSIDIYREQLADAGFESIEIRDATEECWMGFCRSLRDWFRDQPAMEALSRRLEACVAHYVLAAGTRSAA